MRLLSSREVEGNGPMKPGNPPAEQHRTYCLDTGRVPIPAEHSPFVLPCREALVAAR